MMRTQTKADLRSKGVLKEVPKEVPKEAPKDPHWIIVFGKPGCGFTENGVRTLLKDGRYPFVYRSLPESASEEQKKNFWTFAQDNTKGVKLKRTFPAIVVWDPTPSLFDSQTISSKLSSIKDPSEFQNPLVQSRADRGDMLEHVRQGRHFVWHPTLSLSLS